MSDAASKFTVFFEAQGGTAPTGWTETMYSNLPVTDVNLDLLVQNYVPARRQLLGNGAFIQGARLSTIPPNRQASVQFFQGNFGLPSVFTHSPADDYDPTQVDLLLRVDDGNGHRRQFWLGGLPDSQTDQLLAQGMSSGFINSASMRNFKRALTTGGSLGLRYGVTKPPSPVGTYAKFVNVTPIMVRNRKRGRPFELFRGRRLA